MKDMSLSDKMRDQASMVGHYGAWCGGVLLEQGAARIDRLEKALATIRDEAHGVDTYLYDVACAALE